jgi:TRAP-type C4-dicarboxylate transport system permease small subunit
VLGLAMALLAWRSAIGGLHAWSNGSGSMLLGIPEWIVYGAMVPPLALTALVAVMQAIRGPESFDNAA